MAEGLSGDFGTVQGLDKALSAVILHMGSERFSSALRTLLECYCTFDSMVITRYPDRAPPVSLYQNLDEVQAAITVQFYATGPYLLDPFYQACREGCVPGAYRLADLVNEAFFRSEYYRTFYRKIRIADELGILIQQNARDWVGISLARSARQPRFTEAEAGRVNEIFETLSAVVLRNWGLEGAEEAGDGEERLEERLASFGSDRLSPREAEVIQLVLQGHSTPSAAAFLGISEGTVKVHRHNAYSKLGVSSQAELFSAATRHFTAKQV